MVTVMQSTTAGRPEGERKAEGSGCPPCLTDSAEANLNTFFTESSPRLATKARWGCDEGREGGERGESVEVGV